MTPAELLAEVSWRLDGRLAPGPVGPDDGWIGVDALLSDDGLFLELAEAAGTRFRSDDRALVGSQLVREWVSTVVAAAVGTWGRERRLLDWSAANVAVRADGTGTVGLRHLGLTVLPDDELAGAPGVAVTGAAGMADALVARALGHPVPAGARPAGPAHQVAAVAAVIAAARRAVRAGDRHYWGTAGLAVTSGLTAVSHEVGQRADRDRARVLGRRPDLARTVEVVTVDDGLGDTVTVARRLTCCLLVKLPGAPQCGTCSLRDRDGCLKAVTDRARAERARRRAPAAVAG